MRVIAESVLSTWIYSVYEKRRTANVAFRSTSLLIWGKFSSKAASGIFRSCTGSPARCFSLPNSGIHSPHCPNGAAVYRPHINSISYRAYIPLLSPALRSRTWRLSFRCSWACYGTFCPCRCLQCIPCLTGRPMHPPCPLPAPA